MRRAASLAALWAVLAAVPAPAHQRAVVSLERPAAGEVVTGTGVELLLRAGAGQGPIEFAVRLDGRLVDTRGVVGEQAVFTTFRLAPGATTRVEVPLAAPGPHELRVEPVPHGDDPQRPLVRRFSSVLPSAPATPSGTPTAGGEPPGTESAVLPLVGLAAGLVLAGAAFVRYARRRR